MDRISMIFALLSVAISIQGAATLGGKLLSARTGAAQAQVVAAPAVAPAPVVVQPTQAAATAEPAPWIAVRSDVRSGAARMQSRHSKRAGHAR